jgi:hypothetical protein
MKYLINMLKVSGIENLLRVIKMDGRATINASMIAAINRLKPAL